MMRHKEAHSSDIPHAQKGIRQLIAVALLIMFILCLMPDKAEAAGRREILQRRYTLSLNVSLQYGKSWGDKYDNSSFSQAYNAGLKGFIIDPRLAVFDLSASFSDKQASGTGPSGDYTAHGFELKMSFLNAINSRKGIKLWEYVPRPIHVNVSYNESLNSTTLHYGLNTYYSRPGYVKVFSDRKLLSYTEKIEAQMDGRNNNNTNKNRYRVKYKNQLNNNNNNGNGNGNGNSNGNSNGNANRNRNRNNINRNANENWNNNVNLNENFLQQQEAPKGPLFFRFPSVSIDLSRDILDDRAHGSKWSATFGNLRFLVDNPPKKLKKGHYKSNYNLWYSFSETDINSALTSEQRRKDKVLLNARYKWPHFNIDTDVEYQTLSSTKNSTGSGTSSGRSKSLDAYLNLGYSNSYKIISYGIGAAGNYAESDNTKTQSYSVTLNVGTSKSLKFNIRPKLTSETSFSVSADADTSGSETTDIGSRTSSRTKSGQWGYSLSLHERLVSTQLKRVLIQATAGTGYHSRGEDIPVSLGLNVQSVGLRNIRLYGDYKFSKTFPLEDKGSTTDHALRAGFDWRASSSLNVDGYAERSIKIVENHYSYRQERTSGAGNMLWRLSRRASLSLRGRGDFVDADKFYNVSGVFSTTLFTRSSLVVSATSQWDELERGNGSYSKELRVTYGWSYGKTSFDAEFTQTIKGIEGGSETKDNSLMLRVSRSFERTVGRR